MTAAQLSALQYGSALSLWADDWQHPPPAPAIKKDGTSKWK